MVRRKPRIAVLSTGRELVQLDGDKSVQLNPGQLFNSTAPFIRSTLRLGGLDSAYHGIVADDPNDFFKTLDQVIESGADILITTGAVSMGKHDFIPAALRERGAEILFHKVAVRPGKPILFAKIKRTANQELKMFCLPGNPLAVVVGMRFFVDPYLRALSGRSAETRYHARMKNGRSKPGDLAVFLLGQLEADPDGQLEFVTEDRQQSFMLRPLLHANAWCVIGEGKDTVSAEEKVDCLRLYADAD